MDFYDNSMEYLDIFELFFSKSNTPNQDNNIIEITDYKIVDEDESPNQNKLLKEIAE